MSDRFAQLQAVAAALVVLLSVTVIASAKDSPPWDHVSEDARVVAGFADDRSASARLEALRRIRLSRAPADADLLLAIINDRVSYTNLSPGREAHLLNEVFNKINSDPARRNELARELVRLADDEARLPALRDYALQHLSLVYGAARDKSEILQAYVRALNVKDGTMAGTALRALNRLRSVEPSITVEWLADEALGIAQNEEYSVASRAAAIQLGGGLQDERLLPLARSLARATDEPRFIRLAAVRALGEVGTRTDASFLQGLADAQGFYSSSARESLKVLLFRLQSQPHQGTST